MKFEISVLNLEWTKKMKAKQIVSALAFSAILIAPSVTSISTSWGAKAVLNATCSLTNAIANVTSVPNGTQKVAFGFINVKNSTLGPYTDTTAPYSWAVPNGGSYSNPGGTKSVVVVALNGSNSEIARKTVNCA